jgi:NAD(P)-dependent dehydrogenase (short-subunit alcohol dehydrogenase family)
VTARAALVTGASAGIGLAVSRVLAERDFAVTMVGRGRERLDAAAGGLGGEVLAVAADAADEDAMAAAVAEHLERFGRLDVVVANAGTGSGGGVASTRPEHLDRMLRTNVVALFTLARLAMPALREAGAEHRGAWFVVTSSISGVQPAAGFAAYSASKAAALSVARSVNVEESRRGVRACALCPAFVETAMTEWAREAVAADRMMQPSDVAEAVRFLLSLGPNASVTEIVLGRTGSDGLTP